MAIVFACEKCGKRFDVSDELAGKRGRCKQCGLTFVIPGKGPAKTPSPRPKPAPPLPDPYGFDDDFGSPRRILEAEPDDAPVLPKRPGAVPAGAKKKAKNRRGDLFSLADVPGPVYLLSLGYFVLTFVYAFFSPLGFVLFLVGLLVLGGLLGLAGNILSLIVPFREGVVCGLLYLFMPFYALYYLITRWEEMKRPFLMTLLGSACFVAIVLFYPALRIAQSTMVLNELRDGKALANEALASPPPTTREQRYANLEKITRGLIAQTTEETTLLGSIHDPASAGAVASQLQELRTLNGRLHDRYQRDPKPSGFGVFWLTLTYDGALSLANARNERAFQQANAVPGVRAVLAGAYGPAREREDLFGGPPMMRGRPPGPGWAFQPPAHSPGTPRSSFTVVINGVSDRAAGPAIMKRLGEIHGALNTTQSGGMEGRKAGATTTYTIHPKVDLQEFAAAIDFGQLAQVTGDRIVVTFTHLAEVPSMPPVPADNPPAASENLASADGAGEGYSPNQLVDVPHIDGNSPEAFRDVARSGAVLAGVRVSYVNAFGGSKIASVQAVYRSGDQLVAGTRHGNLNGPQIEAIAKPGYAVGAIRTHTGLLVDGFELVFMKVDGQRLDRNDAYQSAWLGDPNGGNPRDADGGGRLAVGLVGRCRSEINGLGLVFLGR